MASFEYQHCTYIGRVQARLLLHLLSHSRSRPSSSSLTESIAPLIARHQHEDLTNGRDRQLKRKTSLIHRTVPDHTKTQTCRRRTTITCPTPPPPPLPRERRHPTTCKPPSKVLQRRRHRCPLQAQAPAPATHATLSTSPRHGSLRLRRRQAAHTHRQPELPARKTQQARVAGRCRCSRGCGQRAVTPRLTPHRRLMQSRRTRHASRHWTEDQRTAHPMPPR